ncbi:unnamed protein product [Ilex paraguariensis]|uniref:DUF3741 domain-containing protein n=1 Tax=Ilex paraguariensis TaxID=185542 RepID=A0ABC8SJC9_9AQUA
MMTGIVPDENLKKQMGCMAGFLQLFDRHQILTGKRLYGTKRLPPATVLATMPESQKSVGSPAISTELEKTKQTRPMASPSPDRSKPSPEPEFRSTSPAVSLKVETPPRSPLPLPIFELKEGTRSSWKFGKEAPRLSLDSRATVDAKGSLHPKVIRTNASILSANRCQNSEDGGAGDCDDKQRRSPSVIARLMGLEPLPNSTPEPVQKAELRRSASESRASRDLRHYRFIDGNNFMLKQPNHSTSMGTKISGNVIRDNAAMENHTTALNVRPASPMNYSSRNAKCEFPKTSNRGVLGPPWKSPQHRKSFFDSGDFFPEPKQTVSFYGEIERRLRWRGIDEPSKDLETLKQILEALQLKGLLHSRKPSEQISQRNFVRDESPIVVMKPSRSPASVINRRVGNDSPPSSFRSKAELRRNLNLAEETLPMVNPRREGQVVDRNVRSPTRARSSSSPMRNESNSKHSNSLVKPKPSSVETKSKVNEPTEQRRVSPVRSPKPGSRGAGAADQNTTSRSPRSKMPTAEIYHKEKITTFVTEDESSSISESTVSTSSHTDTERSKREEWKEGRSLLERCDKLLHSIAEITATDLQPSPVSVLDSSFYKDELSSPSPVMKRSIDFKVTGQKRRGILVRGEWKQANKFTEGYKQSRGTESPHRCNRRICDCDGVI